MDIEPRQKEELSAVQTSDTPAPSWRDLIFIPYTIRAIPEIVTGLAPFIKVIGLRGVAVILTHHPRHH